MGGYGDLQKFKWVNRWQCQSAENKGAIGWLCESTKNKVARKKKTPNLRGKTLGMRETSTGQNQEKNLLCDKIGTKSYSSITLTWVSQTLGYAHNPHNFLTHYFLSVEN